MKIGRLSIKLEGCRRPLHDPLEPFRVGGWRAPIYNSCNDHHLDKGANAMAENRFKERRRRLMEQIGSGIVLMDASGTAP